MKYSNLLLTAAAGLLATACSSDRDVNDGLADRQQQEAPVEIRLGSSLNAVTRAYTATQGNEIAANELIWAWIDDAGEATATPAINASEHVKAWQVKAAALATGETAQALNSVGTTKYYYPYSGRNINVYALHGNFNNTPPDGSTPWDTFKASLTHSVTADQTVSGNYEKSDLFCAHKLNQSKSTTKIELPFKHVLSKVEVYLFRGNGVEAADLAAAKISSVTILNTKLVGDITLTKPSASSTANVASAAVQTSATATAIKMKLQTNASGEEKSDFTPPTGLTDKKAYVYGEAIIIPQTVGDPTASPVTTEKFISVNFAAGGSLEAKIAQKFEAGKKYVFYITVNRTDLTLTATLSDWTSSGSPISGTAE